MPSPPLKANNRFDKSKWTMLTVVVVGSLFYLGLFFNQPSVLGFTDSSGQSTARWIDLLQVLLLDQIAAGMTAHGRLESGWLDRIPILAGVVAWSLLAICIGWPLLLFSTLYAKFSRVEQIALAALCGLALLSTATLAVGLAGGLSSRLPLAVVLAVMAIAAGVAIGAHTRRSSREPERMAGRKENASDCRVVQPTTTLGVWLSRLLPLGTCGAGGLLLLGCLMPPWEFDVVEYHLQAPKEFFQLGAIVHLPHNVYASMPLGAEMHSLAAMTLIGGEDGWWWGGLIGKGLTGSCSLWAAALLGGWFARTFGRWSGWSAAALLLATPGNAHVAMAGLIDMVLAAYLCAAVIVTTMLWPKLRIGTANFGDGLLMGLTAGGAAACKYPGLVLVVVPIVFSAGWAMCLTRRWHSSLRVLAAIGLGLLLTCAPWYAKNSWQVGNPFFPLAADWGVGTLTSAQALQWEHAHQVPAFGNHGPYSLAALWDALQQTLLRSNFLPPTLVCLWLCGAWVVWRKPLGFAQDWPKAWLLAGIWIWCVWWLATHRIDRFWMPALPLACGLAALGATWIAQRLSTSLATGLILLSLVYGGFLTSSGAIGDNRFLVSLSALRSDAGSDELPGRLTRAIGWANETLTGPDVRLLLIGEAKAYDFRMPIVYATCFNTNPGETWLKGQTPEQQRENLHAAGITHVLIHWSELNRYRSPGNYGFSDWPLPTDVEQLVKDHVLVPFPAPLDPRDVEIFAVESSP